MKLGRKLATLSPAVVLCWCNTGGGGASAAPLVVSNTNDSGPRTLRQAIADANATAEADTITFAIPGPGPHTLRPASPLPVIKNGVVIDGSSQPGYAGTPLIELDGSAAGARANGLVLDGRDSAIRGLVVNRFAASGILLEFSATQNVIAGNYIGTDVTGRLPKGNGHRSFGAGISLGQYASQNLVSDNVISGNADGLTMSNGAANTVRSNRIGVDVSGTTSIGDQSKGIVLNISWDNQFIGNVISGNLGSGIYVRTGWNNRFMGNTIGADLTGQNPIPNVDGILLFDNLGGMQNNRIGGEGAGEGNRILFNRRDGIRIQAYDPEVDAVGNAILGNSIYGNQGLGINLIAGPDSEDEVTLNDELDSDSGPNKLQNYPELTEVVSPTEDSTVIRGYVQSLPETSLTIELFRSDAADPSSFGEGEIFLTRTQVKTDARGTASFEVSLTLSLLSGTAISATATDSNGNTSEFSPALIVFN